MTSNVMLWHRRKALPSAGVLLLFCLFGASPPPSIPFGTGAVRIVPFGYEGPAPIVGKAMEIVSASPNPRREMIAVAGLFRLPLGRYLIAVSKGHCYGEATIATGSGLTRQLNVHIEDFRNRMSASEDIYSEPAGAVVGSSPFGSIAVEAVDNRRDGRPAVVNGNAFYFDSIPVGTYEIYIYGPNWTLRAPVVVTLGRTVQCHFYAPAGHSIGVLFETRETVCK